ncbi:Avr1b-1 Avirulence-like protein [Phytophthora palmivora]|uniref:RxLR effector protein n=1 Tax=Phytophthora palmivora TaxID=4796 RepID=A0A2P4X919_9STRA|nr:Avr1b-1 Avirulence-like protein [Phytophthora palmivora]
MTKAQCILIAAIAILLTSCNAASISTLTEVASPDLVSSIDVESAGLAKNRFLRTGKIVDNENSLGLDEDSDEEERGLPPGASEKLANAMAKWTQTTAALNKIDDEAAKIAGTKELYKDMFKVIAETGVTPRMMSKKFDIPGKVNTMKRAALLDDGEYMLWLKYWRWWGKNIVKQKHT